MNIIVLIEKNVVDILIHNIDPDCTVTETLGKQEPINKNIRIRFTKEKARAIVDYLQDKV